MDIQIEVVGEDLRISIGETSALISTDEALSLSRTIREVTHAAQAAATVAKRAREDAERNARYRALFLRDYPDCIESKNQEGSPCLVSWAYRKQQPTIATHPQVSACDFMPVYPGLKPRWLVPMGGRIAHLYAGNLSACKESSTSGWRAVEVTKKCPKCLKTEAHPE